MVFRILFKSHGDFKKQDARLNNRTRWDNPTTSYILQQYDSSDGWGTELLSSNDLVERRSTQAVASLFR